MGILNVTPDSFADMNHCDTTEKAVARGMQLIQEGADIIDVGGESTRPGANEISAKQELDRIVPVLKIILPEAKRKGVLVSVDTRRAEVMDVAIRMGVNIINDISALQYDEKSMAVVAKNNTPVILMHSRGTPKNMKSLAQYQDVMVEIKSFLQQRCEICRRYGITNIALDPGIGFAKTVQHNIDILQNLSEFQSLGYPIVIGLSRKRSVDHWFGNNDQTPSNRDLGSIIGAIWCLQNGVRIVRVHNVRDTYNSFVMWRDMQGKCNGN